MLQDLLEFDPKNRSKAKHLLQNEIFDKIRNKGQEKSAPFQIELEIDLEESFELEDYRELIKKNIEKLKK